MTQNRKNKVSWAGSFVLVTLLVPLFSLALREQTIVIHPGNSAQNSLTVQLQATPSSPVLFKIEITGEEFSSADLSNPIFIFRSHETLTDYKIRQLEEPRTLIQKVMAWFSGPAKMHRSAGGLTSTGKKSWSAKFEIPEHEADRSYVLVPPPLNMADGTTYVFDLPAFVKSQGGP